MDKILEKAKEQMESAAKDVMRMDPPRNLDRPWASVAMQYSNEFITANYVALQESFNKGLKS